MTTEEALEFWKGYPYGKRFKTEGCPTHGIEFLWKSVHGGSFCRVCHPPADPSLVAGEPCQIPTGKKLVRRSAPKKTS